MSEENRHVPLTVLPHSGKVEQLREEALLDPKPADAPPKLADQTPIDLAMDTAKAPRQKLIEGKVIEAIRGVYDPEIPINVFDLGLIYEIAVDAEDRVKVKMTLTAPACPVAGTLPGEVERKIEAIPEVKSASVELVWEPAWDRSRMSEAAQLDLGLL